MRIEVITVELFDCELSKAWDFSKRFFGKPFKAHAPIAIKPLGGHLFSENPKAAVSLVLKSLDTIKGILAVLEATEAEPPGDDRPGGIPTRRSER